MKIQIEVDTSQPLNDVDKAVLKAIGGDTAIHNQSVGRATRKAPEKAEVKDFANADAKEVFKEPVGDLPEGAEPILDAKEVFKEPVGDLPEGAEPAATVEEITPAEVNADNINNPWDDNDLDDNGWPWDPRINNKGRTKMTSNNPKKGVKTGDFKLTRGKTKEELEAIREEHKAAGYPKKPGEAAPQAPEAPQAPGQAPQAQAPQAQAPQAQAPQAPEAPKAEAPKAEAPKAAEGVTYLGLIQQCARDQMAGKTPKGLQNEVAKLVGAQNLQDLSGKTEVYEQFKNYWDKVVDLCEQFGDQKDQVLQNWDEWKCQITQS